MPNTQPIHTVLFIHYGDDWIRGSERCLLDTLNAYRAENIRTILWCNSRTLQQEANKVGACVYRSSMSILFGYDKTRWNIVRWWQQYRFTRTLLALHQPDIVHINSGAPAQWANLACQQMRIPAITQIHAHYGVLKDRVTLGLHQCHRLVGVSHAAIRAFIHDGVPSDRLQIIPNGIDAKRLCKQAPTPIKSALGLNSDDTLLLSVGSLIDRKGHRLLFESIAQLKQCRQRVYAALLGDGPERDALKALARKLNIDNQIFFMGECTNAFGIMQGDADAIVSTAKDEVFGLVLAEGNLARLPVIAPNIVGINSVIKHKITGWLYKSQSTDSLCQAIISLQDKNAWQARISKGYYRASTTFSIERQQQRLLEAYHVAKNAAPQTQHLGLKLLRQGLGQRLKRLWHSARFTPASAHLQAASANSLQNHTQAQPTSLRLKTQKWSPSHG